MADAFAGRDVEDDELSRLAHRVYTDIENLPPQLRGALDAAAEHGRLPSGAQIASLMEHERDLTEIDPFGDSETLIWTLLRDRYGWRQPVEETLQCIDRYASDGILEVGAGSGYWSRVLQARGAEVVAVDVDITLHADRVSEEIARSAYAVYHTFDPFDLDSVYGRPGSIMASDTAKWRDMASAVALAGMPVTYSVFNHDTMTSYTVELGPREVEQSLQPAPSERLLALAGTGKTSTVVQTGKTATLVQIGQEIDEPKVERPSLPAFMLGETEIIQDRTTRKSATTQTIEVVGELNGKVVGRDGARVAVMVSRDAFEAAPKVGDIVTVTCVNGQDRADPLHPELTHER